MNFAGGWALFTALYRYRLAQVGAMFNKAWANGPPLVALNLEAVVVAAGSRELNGRSPRPCFSRPWLVGFSSYYLFRKCSLYRLPAVLNRILCRQNRPLLKFVRHRERSSRKQPDMFFAFVRCRSALNSITPNNLLRGS